jgi:hypothetical protein
MVADLLFRVACHGGGDEPLNVHLKRITDSAYTRKTLGGVDIEGELVAPVIAESHDEDMRREIMNFLRECLSEASGKRWQRIYGALALTENLMQHGSPALLTEVAQGRHFDLVQKVSILESFDAAARGCTDRRAQDVVRQKAKALRTILAAQLEKANAEILQCTGLDSKDASSTCSSGGISTATPGSEASSSRSSPNSSEPSSPDAEVAFARSPSKDVPIDDAFAELRQWMESADSLASAGSSPRSLPGESELSVDDEEWEQLEQLPPSYSTFTALQAKPSGDRRQRASSSDGNDDLEFFTPMPTSAFAQSWSPMRTATLFSL